MMKRKMIDDLAKVLNKTGICVTEDSKYLYRIVTGLAALIVGEISLGMFSYTNHNDFNLFINPICYIGTVFVILCGILTLLFYKRIIGETLHQMDDNIYVYPDEGSLQIQYKWYLEEKNIVAFIPILLYCEYICVLVIFSPSIIELAVYGKVRYIYPAWVPWRTDELKFQLLKLAYQTFQGIFGMWLNHLIMVSIFIMVLEFLRQYERLRWAVGSLKRRTVCTMMLENGTSVGQSSKDQGGDEIFDCIMRNNIIHCIKHHQKLYNTFRLFKIWFSVFFSCELAVSLLSFAMGLYVILNASGIGETINYFGVASISYINILSACFIGELLSDLNDEVRNELFAVTEWCEMSSTNRQLVVIFHLMLSRPFHIYAFSVFGASRATFARILRITYSAFNIINMSLKH